MAKTKPKAAASQQPDKQPDENPDKAEEQAQSKIEARRRRQWLVVSYDIVDDKRRLRVMKGVEGFGTRVQYSVFECEIKPEDVEKLAQKLTDIIDPKVDDVRFYLLCENCLSKVRMLGKAKRSSHRTYAIV